MLNSSEANFGLLREFAFPNSDHGPSGGAETPRDTAITVLIAGDFNSPRSSVSLWLQIAPTIVAVPETAIHKDSKPCDGKYEIRFAKQTVVSPPTSHLGRAKKRNKLQLGGLIS